MPFKTSIIVGFFFGCFGLINNIILATKIEDKSIGFILTSGILFFNIYFTLLFTKKQQNYSLLFPEGFKSAIQAGMIQGLFYFFSIVVIQKYILPGFFPDLQGWKSFMLIFNINLILFSILSAIFGAILTVLLMNNPKS
jgi:hypothetical protein